MTSATPRLPLVKICGVTRVEDAVAALELGVDAIGLNFWPHSPRRVTTATAAEIARLARGRARLIGVFVDASVARMRALLGELGLDAVQLHGDESVEAAKALRAPYWRAFRSLPERGALSSWEGAGAFVVDARAGSAYGGTGRSWDYGALASLPRDGRPILVAGGIRPGNASAALAESGADGVDVASGVEASPGVKDHERMRRLVEEVRRGTT